MIDQRIIQLLATKNANDLYQALNLILEKHDNDPNNLDPILRALVVPVFKPLIASISKSLGHDNFDDEEAA